MTRTVETTGTFAGRRILKKGSAYLVVLSSHYKMSRAKNSTGSREGNPIIRFHGRFVVVQDITRRVLEKYPSGIKVLAK